MQIKNLWHKYSNLGIQSSLLDRGAIKIRLLNQIAIVALVVNFFLMILVGLISLDISSTYPGILGNVFFIAVLVLNKYHFALIARHLSCLIFPLWIAILQISSLVIGGDSIIFAITSLFAFILYDGQFKLKLFSLFWIVSLAVSSKLFVLHFTNTLHLVPHVVYIELIILTAGIFVIYLVLTFYQLDIQKFSMQKDHLVNKLQLKNEELERFAYITSHDLKEPVLNIQSLAHILKKKIDNSAELKKDVKLVEIIDTSAKRMSTMIDSILKFSKLDQQEIPMEEIDLDVLIEEFKKSHGQLLEDKNAIINHSDLPNIIGNKSLLNLLFQNLIENGIKYNTSSNPTIQIHSNVEKEYAQVSIKDNGVGIAEEFKEKIFEPFKRLHNKSEYEGTGLGLSMCKKIVASHSGEIWVETNEDASGSTFMLQLPLIQN